MSVKRPDLGLWIPLCAVCLIAGCFSRREVPSEEVRPVKTMVVAAADQTLVRSFPGIVQASKMADLGFQVPGVLVSLPFREGQRVSKGKVVAQLRSDEFQARVQTMQASLDQARARLRAAESRLTNSKAESERFGRLVDSTAVSRSDYDSVQTQYRAAQEDYTAQQAAIRGIEGQLAEAKLQMGDSSLRAPYDGVVAQRLVDVGQNIFPNNPVIRFQNVSDIDIVVDVPEGFVGSDLRGSAIQHSVAELSTVPGRQFPVRIKEIAQIADPRTQVFQVRFTMKAPPRVTALPGMTANVTMTTRGNRGPENHAVVPISAVSKLNTGEQVVWLLGADQTVHHRLVTLGAPNADQIEILSGLQSGDRIVVAGTTFLRDGIKVHNLGDALGARQ
jgi:membrane fusion protein, multidrug efflux system